LLPGSQEGALVEIKAVIQDKYGAFTVAKTQVTVTSPNQDLSKAADRLNKVLDMYPGDYRVASMVLAEVFGLESANIVD